MRHPSDEDFFRRIIPGLLGWCSEEKARRLAQIVRHRRARTVVEIGVFGGRSLVALGVGGRHVGARVVGIDPYAAAASLEGKNSAENDEWWARVDYEAVYRDAQNAASLVGASVMRAKSIDVAPLFDAGGVDVIHIDGNHSEETSTEDVRVWLPKLALGAFIIFDDIAWSTTNRAQKMILDAGCVLVDSRIAKDESWGVFQAVGVDLKSCS